MGCRTRANEYYGYRSTQEVEGNVVRKTSSVPAAQVRLKRTTRAAAGLSRNRKIRAQKIRLAFLGFCAAVLSIALICVLLNSLETHGTLKRQVTDLEDQIEELTAFNDAREYEIGSSVDLNEVIRVATEEMGMVRSNAAQVVTFRAKNSEYLQQVAAVPME